MKLPAELAGASVTGEVYVTTSPTGATLILFPTWVGKAGNVNGYLYCNRALTPQDTYEDDGNAINLYGPLVRLKGAPGQPGVTQPYEHWIRERIDENWHIVCRSID